MYALYFHLISTLVRTLRSKQWKQKYPTLKTRLIWISKAILVHKISLSSVCFLDLIIIMSVTNVPKLLLYFKCPLLHNLVSLSTKNYNPGWWVQSMWESRLLHLLGRCLRPNVWPHHTYWGDPLLIFLWLRAIGLVRPAVPGAGDHSWEIPLTWCSTEKLIPVIFSAAHDVYWV